MTSHARGLWALFICVGTALAPLSLADAQPKKVDVPPALEPYREWVLHGVDDFGCVQRQGSAYCVWPGALELELTETGGRFEQVVLVDRSETTFALPGARGRFPLDVRIGPKVVPVIESGGVPAVLLERGTHTITGRFEWKSLPERLEVPRSTALIALNVLGQAVPFPKRNEHGQLWLQGSAAADPKGEQLTISVARMLEDGVPLVVNTRIELRIAGRAREINLGRVLLPGTTPLSLDSGLPARLEEGGELRVQASAGTYQLYARARVNAAPNGQPEKLEFKRPSEHWPEAETWVWRGNEKLRQVELSGAPAIDPSRTDLEPSWHGMPTYLLSESDALVLTTVRRGEPAPPPNHVSLRRELWLDLDGSHFTVRDHLETTMRDGFRLDLEAGELGHVSANGEDLLITKRGKGSGVELRNASQSVTAEWRATASGEFPAVGWSEDVQALQATLNLGPGYKLLAAQGVDFVSESWLQDWDLYDFFFVLVIAIAALRLIGKRAAALALLTLVLCHQESDAPGAVWLALLAWIALLRVLPAGWFRNLARLGYAATAITLLLIAVPFVVQQARAALYPQLDGPRFGGDMLFGGLARQADFEETSAALEMPMPVTAPMAPPPPAEPMPASAEEAVEEDAEGGRGRRERALEVANQAEQQLLKSVGDGYDASADMLRRGALKSKRATYSQDPEAAVQTGPGVPTWNFRSWQLSWSGPVDGSHTIKLYILTPFWHRVLCVGRILTLLGLAFFLLRAASFGRDKPPSIRPKAPSTGAGATVAAATLLALAFTGRAHAQPSSELLDELRRRLTERDACNERCTSIAELAIEVRPTDAKSGVLTLSLEAHATAPTTIALPGPAAIWVPESVTLDKKPAAIALLDDGFLHVRVTEGVHVIEARGPLPESDALTLSLLEPPIRATVAAEGYKVDGVREDGQVEGTVQIARLLDDQTESTLERAALPPFLRVTRKLELGPTWTVQSTVERVSPTGSPIRASVPLLPSESVNDGWLEVDGGAVQISLGRDDQQIGWTSTLKPGDRIELSAPQGKPFTERWIVACGPIWHCTFEGIAPIERIGTSIDESGTPRDMWLPQFAPWPGEKVSVIVTRPQSAGGQSVTIDSATLTVTPGVRMQRALLSVSVRTSRGASHSIHLPKDARVQALTVNGETRPIRFENGKLSVTLGHGAQSVNVEWQAPIGMSAAQSVPKVTLDRPASNVRLAINVPDDRWLLWASGPAWGPAILFWGYLLMVIAAAYALARTKRTPLTVVQWLLLGLGLTQVPAFAALVVVGWFFAMTWRKTRGQSRDAVGGVQSQTRFVHNVTQLLLAWLTVAALGCLYAAVHSGLLVQPDMQVAGGGSSSYALNWYVDRVAGELPSASILSAPLWVYRLLMLLWSLWLAASIVRWLPWAFTCFKEGGLWKSAEKKAPPRSMPPVPPPPLTVPPPAPPPSGAPPSNKP